MSTKEFLAWCSLRKPLYFLCAACLWLSGRVKEVTAKDAKENARKGRRVV